MSQFGWSLIKWDDLNRLFAKAFPFLLWNSFFDFRTVHVSWLPVSKTVQFRIAIMDFQSLELSWWIQWTFHIDSRAYFKTRSLSWIEINLLTSDLTRCRWWRSPSCFSSSASLRIVSKMRVFLFLWRTKCVIFYLEHEHDMPFVSISMFLTIIDVLSRVRFPIVLFKVIF